MSRRHFSILLILAVVAVLAVALLVPRETAEPRRALDQVPLYPDLAATINDADALQVRGAGDSVIVRLERTADGWVLPGWSGYPANWPVLRTVLADLAEARVTELKTDNPAYFDRLGVEPVDRDDASGTLLELGHGDEQRRLVVGLTPTNGTGRYVRKADSDQALLVDRPFNLPTAEAGWAAREIADIGAGAVREVEILHPDGERILVQKEQRDDPDFTLVDLPEGRSVQSSWSLNQLAGALASLQLDAVRPVGDIDWADAVRFRLQRFDGLEVIVEATEHEGQPWIRLDAAAYPPVNAGDAVEGEGERKDAAAIESAEALSTRVDGWAYQVPRFRYETLTRRREDLLQPLEEPGSDSGG